MRTTSGPDGSGRAATDDLIDPDGTLLRALLATAATAVVTIDRAGVITSWNVGAERMLGYRADELVGQHVAAIVPATLVPHLDAMHARVFAGERVDEVETVRRHRDGSLRHIALTVVPRRDATHRIIGATALARDITERKRADEARDALIEIVDHSRDFIAMATLDGQLLFMNAAGRRMIGLPDDRPLATLHVTDYVPESWQDHLRNTVLPGARSQGVWEGEMQLRHLQTGALIDVVRTTFVLHDAAGQPRAYATVTRDVTATKRAEAMRRQAEKMESLGTLASGIAHDFNNLTAAMRGFAELASMQLDARHPARDYLQEIVGAADRAQQLVGEIMAFARATPRSLTTLALGPTVERAARMLRATLPAEVELVTAAPATPLHVCADDNQLTQVLVNLCTNAWHALDGRPGRVTIELTRADVDPTRARAVAGLQPGPHAVLGVRDTGAGMDPATRARMFEPFFTTKPGGQGTGLGLAVVHSIVASHGGAIDVHSTPGAGTSIHVYLPLAVDAPPATASPSPAARRDGHGEHIMYVDDEPALLKLSSRLLELLGYRVTGFTTGDEALAALTAAPGTYALVITDLHMPRMSGLDLAQAIAAQGQRVPVLLQSGDLDEALLDRARRAGVRQVLPKPATIDAMSEAIAEALQPAP